MIETKSRQIEVIKKIGTKEIYPKKDYFTIWCENQS